jgi:hypothetical protein
MTGDPVAPMTAAIDGISLSESQYSKTIQAAVAFNLVEASGSTFCRCLEDWEIEIQQGRKWVVARCCRSIAPTELADEAIEAVHRFLDLLSIERRNHLVMQAPGDNQILLFRHDSGTEIQHRAVFNQKVSVTLDATVLDAEGHPVQLAATPALVWSPAFRYYRLSQSSTDLFEAYRNLFLALEALLHELCPKNGKEGEKKWLRRALNHVSTIVDLSRFAPPNKNPVAYIIGTQYEDTRVRLFHAGGSTSILPHGRIAYSRVSERYERLIALWEEIARQCASVRTVSGAVTNAGFRQIWEPLLQEFQVSFTEDLSPAHPEDTALSPLGLSCYDFQFYRYVGEIEPGKLEFNATVEDKALLSKKTVGRIGTTCQNTLVFVAFVEGGLMIENVDRLETRQFIRLNNTGLPRIRF